MLLRKQPFKLWGTSCEACSLALGSPGCISVSGLGRKHSKGKKGWSRNVSSVLSWLLEPCIPQEYCQSAFQKKIFFKCSLTELQKCFMSWTLPCWTRPLTESWWKSVLQGHVLCCMHFILTPSHWLLFSMALWSFLIFHSKFVPVDPVPIGTFLLEK